VSHASSEGDDGQSDVDSDDSMELQRFDTEVCLPKSKITNPKP
jgi:hypothetical protein